MSEEFEEEYYDISDDESVASDFDDAFSLDEDEEDDDEDTDESEEETAETNRAKEREENKKRKEVMKKRQTEEADKMPRTIFVGNLPLSITRKSLAKLFSPYGQISSVRLRGAIPESGKGRGLKKKAIVQGEFHAMQRNLYGYVVFESESNCAIACREMNGYKLDGRHLRVDNAMSGGTTFNARHCVFVGGVPYVADEEALRQHFSVCGDIENIRIVRDSCGAPKGIAFIEFCEEQGAVGALKKNGSILSDRTLRVQRWSRKEQEKRGQVHQRDAMKVRETKGKRKGQNTKNWKKEKFGRPGGGSGEAAARSRRGKPIRIPTSIRKNERAQYIKQVLDKRRRQSKSKGKEATKRKTKNR